MVDDAIITNRELASLIILGGFALWLLLDSRRRSSLKSVGTVIAMLFSPTIAIPLLFYVAWVFAALVPADAFGIWEPSLWKPTLLWLFLSGVGLVLNLGEAIVKEDFFRRALIRTAEITALIEFFAALKSFPLWLEIPAQLLAILFSGVAVVARQPAQQSVRRFANGYLVAFGLVLLVWSALALIKDWDETDGGGLLLDFLLPLWLTPVALVYVYVFAIYAAHEQIGRRMSTWSNERLRHQRLAVLLRSNLRLGSLRAVLRDGVGPLARTTSFQDAWSEIGQAQDRHREEEVERNLAIDRTEVAHTAAHGRALDETTL